MSKRTEGDWNVAGLQQGSHTGDHYTYVYAAPGNTLVAIVRGETVEQCTANACLVAAAPSLLEACRASYRCMQAACTARLRHVATVNEKIHYCTDHLKAIIDRLDSVVSGEDGDRDEPDGD